MPNIISIGTFKGGVGKTMTAISIAGILAEQGYNVLLIDVDPQGNTTSRLGIERADSELIGVEKIFINTSSTPVDLDDLVIHSPVSELPKLDLLPSTIKLNIIEPNIAFVPSREYKMKYFIEDNKTAIDYYDYIIIDTNPSMGLINQNAFVVSDHIIMPMTADLSDVEGVQLFCATWDRIRIDLRVPDNISAVVATKIDMRNLADKTFIPFIRKDESTKDINSILCSTFIPVNVSLKNASNEGKPINIYDKKSNGYRAYHSLVKELRKKGVL